MATVVKEATDKTEAEAEADRLAKEAADKAEADRLVKETADKMVLASPVMLSLSWHVIT